MQPTRPPRCSVSLFIHARALYRQSHRALLLVHDLVIVHAPFSIRFIAFSSALLLVHRKGGGHCMLRCSSAAERSLSPPSEKCLCSVIALSCKRMFGKCAERDTNALRHISILAHAIHIGCMCTHASAHAFT